MTAEEFDVVVAGAGLVGLATARALARAGVERVVVLEAEREVAAHQSGHNSGVIHSGLYYRPGSWKARLCREGREALYAFCAAAEIRHERCGKLVVATSPAEEARLAALAERGRANGLQGLERLGPEGIREHEPHARGRAALLVPETGIVDFREVARALATELLRKGVAVRFTAGIREVRREGGGQFLVDSWSGDFRCRHLVACAGLQADRLARACGLRPEVRILPYRGEYQALAPEARHLVRNLVYPVPDPRFPFLGVHFTRKVDGAVEVGPNAVPAWARHGYCRGDLVLRDALESLAWPGFWRVSLRYAGTGLGEIWRSRNRRAFARALQRLVPEVQAQDLGPAGAGVRAQAVRRDGRLVDDFLFLEAAGMTHVLNAPSPAATACLAIGREIAARVLPSLGLPAERAGPPA